MISERNILYTASSLWGTRTLENCALKLAEECGEVCGEVCGAVNKIPEGRATDPDLDAELGDVLIVLAQLAALRGTSLKQLQENRWKEIVRRNELKPHPSNQGARSDLVCRICGKRKGQHRAHDYACPVAGSSRFNATLTSTL